MRCNDDGWQQSEQQHVPKACKLLQLLVRTLQPRARGGEADDRQQRLHVRGQQRRCIAAEQEQPE